MRLILALNMRCWNNVNHQIAVLILVALFFGISIAVGYAEPNSSRNDTNRAIIIQDMHSGSSSFPNVIGKHQIEAEKELNSIGIKPQISYGVADGYQERYVFDQKVNGSNLTILVNKRLDYLRVKDKINVKTVNLSQNDKDIIYSNSSTIVVEGRLLSDLKPNEHLWIAVRPDNSIANWWPQSDGDLKPNRYGEFKGNAFLGGYNQVFTVEILILNDTINRTFSEWEMHSKTKNLWPPITEGDPITRNKVSKNLIEENALSYIEIMLEEKNVSDY